MIPTGTNDPLLRALRKANPGEEIHLIDWLEAAYLGEIPEPLSWEEINDIPEELQGELQSLPPQYVPKEEN